MTNDSSVYPPAAAGLKVPTVPTMAPAIPASAAAMPKVSA